MIVDAKLERKHVKCVVVGDAKVGKTSLIVAAVNKELPTAEDMNEPPGVHRKVIYVKNHRHEVDIYDTGSDERHRIASYTKADVIMLCFATSDYRSFRKTRKEWAQEIKEYCPQKPFIVVGTKTDIREELRDPTDVDFIDDLKAARMAKQLGANYYVGCSAMSMTNTEKVFEIAVLATKEISHCLDRTDVKGASQSVVETVVGLLPKPDLSAISDYNPVEFSKRCAPVFKQTFINLRECWSNPKAFTSTKRKVALFLPCLSSFIPIDEEEHQVHIETPPAPGQPEKAPKLIRDSANQAGPSNSTMSHVSTEELDMDTKSVHDATNQSGRDTFEHTVKLEEKEEREKTKKEQDEAKKKEERNGNCVNEKSTNCMIQ
ncbi:hypothetical protein QR680_014089 [Steinernema hermaphroditum]|uniref:Uncharacterized protein n=1 Tax=Steinernema hermaphroditum TaxID=289476 RepID=A0AA39I7P1_9BILA|nr:hypothetical protein QR680_014089 [Steinernema hermaphroditum]